MQPTRRKKIYRQNKRTSPVEWEENLSPEFYDEHHELWDAVIQLDGGYRDVIVLFYYERCTIPEISRILECRQGTVKSRLHRAKRAAAGNVVAAERSRRCKAIF